MKKLATDKHRFAQIRMSKFRSVSIRVYLWLFLSLCLGASVAIVLSSRAQQNPATAPSLEGCLKCHDKIEPMHRYGPTVAGALDKLDNGKDALGLTCTACHGGNPVATTKEEPAKATTLFASSIPVISASRQRPAAVQNVTRAKRPAQRAA